MWHATCRDVRQIYRYGYASERGVHTPTSGEWLKSFSRHGDKKT